MIQINRIYCENCLDTLSKMPDEFVDMTITSRRRRLLDEHDNLRGGTCKQVVDALVTMGWIKGDAVKDCKIIIEQIKSKEDDTVIELC